MTENDYIRRINKLDSFLLWIASLSGVGFSILIGIFKLPWIPYLPIFILIGYAIYVGYLQGAVFSESFSNRIRGWNYLLSGLAIYVPLVSIKFNEKFLQSTFGIDPAFVPSLTTYVALAITVIYIIVTKTKLNAIVYKSFNQPYGNVTKNVFNRTYMASFILAFTLYVFAIALSQASFDIYLGLYFAFLLLLIVPMALEERKIKKLLLVEKLQAFVQVERVQKNLALNIFIIIFGIVIASLLVTQEFPAGHFQPQITIVLLIIFAASILGLYFALIYSDRGDMVIIKDTFEVQPTEQEMEELENIVPIVNS